MNELIISSEIRVIADDGEQLGVMTPSDALERAREVGLDLVEVAPGSKPPVCRIMDYGRYKYERKKKMGKSKGHTASLKEVKLRPRTDQHDLDFKLKNARRFLIDGDKVKVTVMYRGREMVHREFGYRQLKHVTELLSDIANVENPPRMEGRFLSMILVPNREAVAGLRRAQASTKAPDPEEPVAVAQKDPVAVAPEDLVAVAKNEPPTADDLGDAKAAPPMTGGPEVVEAAEGESTN
jgi:translation initiation factor IF-3